MSCRSRPKTARNTTLRPAAPQSGRLGFVIAVLLSLLAGPVIAQSSTPARDHSVRSWGSEGSSVIYGNVLHAGKDAPVGAARVYIEAIDSLDQPASSGSFQAFRMVVTDTAGEYVLDSLDPGVYRIHVRSPGFEGASADVALPEGARARLSFELEFRPIPMTPVAVVGVPEQSFLRATSAEALREGARRTVAANRQTSFLESDVRTLTTSDVLDAITLAEPDLFRALQRVPGVSRRDDYTAILWTRGAPWDHTRVYFDGMPLYNPTHGGWLFSAINPDGIGEAIFQPGVRSVERGEGAAAILDLQTRRGAATGVNWRGEMSIASAKFSGDGALPGGGSWMMSARRTYIDVLSAAWDVFGGTDEHLIPYDFADGIGRVDVPLFAGVSVEASGVAESDRLRGDIPDLLERNTAAWGNRAGRVSLRVPLPFALVTATRGGTRFRTNVDEAPPSGVDPADGPTLSPLESSIAHDRLSLRIEAPSAPTRKPAWAFGVERIRERLLYAGPFSLTGEGIPGLEDEQVPFSLQASNEYTAYWGETRVTPVTGLNLHGGVRVEVGDSVRGAGPTRVSPRFSARWNATDALAISGGWGRSFQYTQAIGASGGPLGPQLHIGNLWVLATRGYSPLRSEVFTLGTEVWLASSWLLGLNTYLRKVDGVMEPDPTPGPIEPFANTVEGWNKARGIEFSARKLVGNWTMGLGYSYGESWIETKISESHLEAMRYSAASDVRHTADLTAAYRLSNGLRLGGAFSVASGVPFTRILTGEKRREEPNANRTPTYQSLDLTVDYETRLGDNEVSAYVQILNALGRNNAVTYAGSELVCPGGAPPGSCFAPVTVDKFRSGLPRLPLFGFRIAF